MIEITTWMNGFLRSIPIFNNLACDVRYANSNYAAG